MHEVTKWTINELNDAKTKVTNLLFSFQKYGLLIIITLIIGMVSGVLACKHYYKWKMEESVTLGAFMYNKKVYIIQLK